jgi:hypothetical protein
MTAQPKPPITPRTKVADLLDAYPELEDVLVEMAPPFKKLGNPVLRRTIARVTSLEKAAAVADIPLRDLISELRRAAGQTMDDEGDDIGEERPAGRHDGPADWVDASRVVWTIDADRILHEGGQPINEAQSKARDLGSGDLGLIRSSFRPAPLIDLLEKQGYRTAVVRSDDSFATFLSRRPGGPEHQD